MNSYLIETLEIVGDTLTLHIKVQDRNLGRCILHLLALHDAQSDMSALVDYLAAQEHVATRGLDHAP